MSTLLETDICILGGGIAGLWLNARLRQQGYSTLLLETATLGGGQSIKSQGIIHGGTKYALHGKLTTAAEAIAAMPKRWRDCLEGTGEIDLTSVRLLSPYHYLWSPGGLVSNMAGFFASKALRGRVDAVKGETLPPVFQSPRFKGKVYRLAELVLDVPSVIQRLSELADDSLIAADSISIERDADNQIACVRTGDLTIKAQRYVLTGGEGNQALQAAWGVEQPAMQRRPLQMVLVKGAQLPGLYAHCLGSSPKPRLTVTTHPTADGQWCWYLGGELAEQGVDLSAEALIKRAQTELAELLPWVDLSACQWATLKVNRAEPAQSGLVRPDSAYVQGVHNALVCWPTKLALSPHLSDLVLEQLQVDRITPSKPQPVHTQAKPAAATPIWDTCF
ncbi:MAG: FAD-dependent oxidoreductase [Pseudomonadaceae bacterium]|nr:MAG: FAD-dependent oxidoreductase [Pseudomonadaceae bacterium]